MDELTTKDVFDMNNGEFKAHLAPVLNEAIQKSLDEGLYFSYPADINEDPAMFIHEYKDGKRVLVRVDINTGREEFVRNL